MSTTSHDLESFIGALDSFRLRAWYRSELGQLSRSLYLLKSELLSDLVEVLDESSIKKLARFVKKYWLFATHKGSQPSIVKGMEPGILFVIPHTKGPVFEAACKAFLRLQNSP